MPAAPRMNYTLVAYSPWEGLEIKFHGTKGELTHRHVEVHGIFGGKRTPGGQRIHRPPNCTLPAAIRSRSRCGAAKARTAAATASCSAIIFDKANVPPDKYGRAASEVMGAWSILTGIAANQSIATGAVIDVDRLLEDNGIALARPS